MWVDFGTQLIYYTAMIVVFLFEVLCKLLPVIDRLVALWTMPVAVPLVII